MRDVLKRLGSNLCMFFRDVHTRNSIPARKCVVMRMCVRLCVSVLCCAALRCVVLCCVVPCSAVPCRVVPCRAVLCLCCAVLYCAVICCAVLCVRSVYAQSGLRPGGRTGPGGFAGKRNVHFLAFVCASSRDVRNEWKFYVYAR